MGAKALQARIQKFGATLSAMVMPNIGVFIGWGVLTALFIPTGWAPNDYWNILVGPILKYLIPALIGYTAGYNIHGRRGGVIGGFATMGVVIGSDVPMLVGGMIMGPLAAVILKKFDAQVQGKVKVGLEMLVDNFSLGLIGVLLCMLGYAGVAPVMTAIQNVLSVGVNYLCETHLIALSAIFVQPAQVLFLNNAVNHGILVPLGLQQAAETGKSVLFLIEANGAYWVGHVAAFAVFATGIAKKTAPGAVIIQFFGGIAETCFPYCLMQPITILGPIAGNIFALLILTNFDGGAVGPPSPGSVFAFYMMTPKDCMAVNSVAYFGSMIVSFLVTGMILKLTTRREENGESIDAPAISISQEAIITAVKLPASKLSKLNKVIFACDAGMGSSAMGVSILKTRLQKAGLYPAIEHVAVAEIPQDADIVVTNANLVERARNTTGDSVPIIPITNFMDQKEYDNIVRHIQGMLSPDTEMAAAGSGQMGNISPDKPIFCEDNILLRRNFSNKKQAIEACADILINGGYAGASYKEDMLKRDADVSVYMGKGVALPHGLNSSKDTIRHSGICFIQVPQGVDFDGQTAYLLIGVAGRGEEHVAILGQIAQILLEEENIHALRNASTKREVMDILQLNLQS